MTKILVVLLLGTACTDYNLQSASKPQTANPEPSIMVEPTQVDLGIVCNTDQTSVFIRNDGDGILEIQALSITGTGWSVLNSLFLLRLRHRS